jgi:Ni,Fe-hydrogenase III small subunit
MRWWPLYGLSKRLTERKEYNAPLAVRPFYFNLFKRSLFVYIIDVGSSNALNFEISALESPLYNIHRFGVFITDSPRHADLLLVLGRPTKSMLDCLQETILQLPTPFGIVTIDDGPDEFELCGYPELPNHVAALKGIPNPSEILGLLMDLSKPKRHKS